MEPIKLRINLDKIDQDAVFQGAKGRYFDVIVWPNKGESKFGEIGMAKQDLGKERKGEQAPILGNAFPLRKAEPKPAAPAAKWEDHETGDDIPF
jgi:hypothetical protein